MYYRQMQSLTNRAAENNADIKSISPPMYLNEFWAGITKAMGYFCEATKYQYGINPLGKWALPTAVQANAVAWLELHNVCGQYGVKMEWPLPRNP